MTAFAVQAAHILGLNYNLVEAGALGHDLGHAPFGHLGEAFISKIITGLNPASKNFRHEIMSVIAAQKIERGGRGLNLSYETLLLILKHSRGRGSLSLSDNLPEEVNLLMYADKIAYTFSDLNDALRIGHFKQSDLPPLLLELGVNQRTRINNCLLALVRESGEAGKISFQASEVAEKFEVIRNWSYENFYSRLDGYGPRGDLKKVLSKVYGGLLEYREYLGCEPLLALSLLTDLEATVLSDSLGDLSLREIEKVKTMSFMEIIHRLPVQNIDLLDPDLEVRNFGLKDLE